ncbi:MAG: glycosyltransferase family 2 protein [Myxococcales bacterium]|nr:glycosyltransferase family 2 protein [Myxococcales bacterium]
MKISVTVITRDEERNIARCLASVPFADEIVVVDSGSTDQTVEIARQFTDRVVTHEWEGHVRQKQYAVDLAAHDWILSLDADEVVSEPLRHLIEDWKTREPAADAYLVNRRTFYLGKWINHSGWYPDARIRLFDRRRSRWGGYDPHDEVICAGRTGVLAGDLLHYSYRDLSHHLQQIDKYTSIMAEQFWAKGRRASLPDLLFRPPFAFLKKYVAQGGFLDGRHGLLVCILTAYYVFCKYAKLWERSLVERRL